MISGVQKGFDIRLISLISDCCIRLKHYCFQRYFIFFIYLFFFTLWPVHWYLANIQVYPADIFQYSAEIGQIYNWNLVNFLLISIHYTSDILLISLIPWYPVYRFPARRYPLIGVRFWHSRNLTTLDTRPQVERFNIKAYSSPNDNFHLLTRQERHSACRRCNTMMPKSLRLGGCIIFIFERKQQCG